MELQQLNNEALSLTNPDFAKFAEACGGKGFNVYEGDVLKGTLQAAFACGQPALVDVHTSAPLFPGLRAKQEKSTASGT